LHGEGRGKARRKRGLKKGGLKAPLFLSFIFYLPEGDVFVFPVEGYPFPGGYIEKCYNDPFLWRM
jgi:hypothetical protein